MSCRYWSNAVAGKAAAEGSRGWSRSGGGAFGRAAFALPSVTCCIHSLRFVWDSTKCRLFFRTSGRHDNVTFVVGQQPFFVPSLACSRAVPSYPNIPTTTYRPFSAPDALASSWWLDRVSAFRQWLSGSLSMPGNQFRPARRPHPRLSKLAGVSPNRRQFPNQVRMITDKRENRSHRTFRLRRLHALGTLRPRSRAIPRSTRLHQLIRRRSAVRPPAVSTAPIRDKRTYCAWPLRDFLSTRVASQDICQRQRPWGGLTGKPAAFSALRVPRCASRGDAQLLAKLGFDAPGRSRSLRRGDREAARCSIA